MSHKRILEVGLLPSNNTALIESPTSLGHYRLLGCVLGAVSLVFAPPIVGSSFSLTPSLSLNGMAGAAEESLLIFNDTVYRGVNECQVRGHRLSGRQIEMPS